MGKFRPPNNVPPFMGFTTFTPALPEFYWDVYSAEQRLKHLCKEFQKMVCYADSLADNINIDHKLIEELQQVFDDFMESGFDDYYKAQVAQWINDNLKYLFENFVRGVYFGLTLDGHFVAYIPDSWNDIVFDTGMDYSLDTYGRLILRMDVDSPYSVEQTPEPNRYAG